MVAILSVGAATAFDLETDGSDPEITRWVDAVALVTSVVFTVECALKIVAEGKKPHRYFFHPKEGYFNSFDFFVVVATFALWGRGNVSSLVLQERRLATYRTEAVCGRLID